MISRRRLGAASRRPAGGNGHAEHGGPGYRWAHVTHPAGRVGLSPNGGVLLALLAVVSHAACILPGRGGWGQVGFGEATFLAGDTSAHPCSSVCSRDAMDRGSGARRRETARLPVQDGCRTTWTSGTVVDDGRLTHNPEVAGSNPAPATSFRRSRLFSYQVRAFGVSGV